MSVKEKYELAKKEYEKEIGDVSHGYRFPSTPESPHMATESSGNLGFSCFQ